MVCKKCGAAIGANVPVCPVCGAPLAAAGAARNPKPTDLWAETPAAAQVPQNPGTQANLKFKPEMKPQKQTDLWGKTSSKKQFDPAPQQPRNSRPDPKRAPQQYPPPGAQPNPAPRQNFRAQPNPAPQQNFRAQPNRMPPQYPPQPPVGTARKKKNDLLPLILTACGIAVLVIVFAVIAIVLAGKNTAAARPTAAGSAIFAALNDRQADYDAAAAAMDAGSYREAAGMFEALDDFSDSAAMAEECLNEADYIDAQALLEAGNYQDAVALLQQLGDYKDSADLLAQCSLCLPQSVLDELDDYFRQTLQDTFDGPSWSHDYLDNMELLGRYELISRTNGSSDNYLYLVYRVTAYNSATDTSTDYYWFGCCEDVSVSSSGTESDSSRTCFTNGAGDNYRLYISGSSYYYYGFSTEDDFYIDRISPLETDYFQTWTPADQ